MFYIKEPATLGSPWILSNYSDERIVAVAKDTTKDLKSYHVLGVDFLYQNYKKQFKGAILNEEEGMNMRIQVAAFLNAMFNYLKRKFLVLVIIPDDSLINWHYHLTIHSGLKVQIITPQTCPEDFDQGNGLALLLTYSNIKLAEHLMDYDYFSVVIDNFDEVASKLVVRKLYGSFNIGLTQKNFYTNPNQKLQWTMLNWSNPGCVGKLNDFYEIDSDNFANFRDNYRYWWFRLTWNFCESFKRVTDEEREEYTKVLTKWANTHHLKNMCNVKNEKKVKKRKKLEVIEDRDVKVKIGPQIKSIKTSQSSVIISEGSIRPEIIKMDESVKPINSNSESSNDTIIYEDTELEKGERDPNYVKLPSMDENPILSSIIRNFEKSPEPATTHHSPYNYNAVKFDLDQPTCSKSLEDDNILLSIIDNDTTDVPMEPDLDDDTQISYKKEELYSQIFNDDPCTSKSLPTADEDTEFFESLVESDTSVGEQKGGKIRKGKIEDVDDILKETEILLIANSEDCSDFFL